MTTYREQQVELLEKQLAKQLLKNNLHKVNPFSMIGHRFLLKSFYKHGAGCTASEFQTMLNAIKFQK